MEWQSLPNFKRTQLSQETVKFGIVINVPFAKDLVIMLNKKIEECEEVITKRAERGEHK